VNVADGQTPYCGVTALCVALRGQNYTACLLVLLYLCLVCWRDRSESSIVLVLQHVNCRYENIRGDDWVRDVEFLQRVSIACYAERCISYGKSVRLSVRPSVRHTLALSQNDSSYDHGVFKLFTGG